MWDLPPDTRGIGEGQARDGVSDGGSPGFVAPCPPNGEHRYVFKLFALDTMLGASSKIGSAADLMRAMDGHTLDGAELVGRYRRPISTMMVPALIVLVPLAVLLYGAWRGVRFFRRRRRD
jgi:phosphatidylethanolamine-binding protein (PEBP) family uncharacterized protein